MLDKKLLRREVRMRLAVLDAVEASRRSASICDEVKKHLVVSGARVVALFSPIGHEPDVWPLAEQLAARMLVVLPRVEGDVMNFYCYDGRSMATGAYGISEPQGGESVGVGEIDAMVVPGVAFTAAGERMGRGKGYYDKYMSQPEFRALKIGVCYKEQLLVELPVEPHDVKMDCVVFG